MNLSYKEKSLLIAGLSELSVTKDWKSSIHLMDLRETLNDTDIDELVEKLVLEAHKDLDQGKCESLTWRHHATDTRGLSPNDIRRI